MDQNSLAEDQYFGPDGGAESQLMVNPYDTQLSQNPSQRASQFGSQQRILSQTIDLYSQLKRDWNNEFQVLR